MSRQAAGAEADPGTTSRVTEATRSPWLMLAMATLGFAVNFWAWALISPLGPLFRDDGTLGTLTESDVALMVAVPWWWAPSGGSWLGHSPTSSVAG